MVGWLFLAELNRERAARRHKRALDEQAERQRQRASEPTESAPAKTGFWTVLIALPFVIGCYMIGEAFGWGWYWALMIGAGLAYGFVRSV